MSSSKGGLEVFAGSTFYALVFDQIVPFHVSLIHCHDQVVLVLPILFSVATL